MPRPIEYRNPNDIRWTQQTTQESFSQGSDNSPAKRILSVAADIRRNTSLVEEFPPLQIFTLTDPDEGTTFTYSLSNRRLTAFKEAGVDSVKVQKAKFSDIYHSLWQLTSILGGVDRPIMTSVNANKDARPEAYTTLGKFRNAMEDPTLMHVYQNYCEKNKYTEIEKDNHIKNGLKLHARARFRLNV